MDTATRQWLAEIEDDTATTVNDTQLTTDDIQQAAILMLMELDMNRLEVALVPSASRYQPTNQERRVVVSQNPKWYRALCAEFPRAGQPRKNPRTIIKRKRTLAALSEIASSGAFTTVYAERLEPYVKEYARNCAAAPTPLYP